jgi:catechol 2,3-dioxygenase
MSTTIHRPAFHHVNLKTNQLQAMIDWYSTVVGAEVMYQYEMGAWLSNDDANHRIALLAFPNFGPDAEHDNHVGMHHSAFEYTSFDAMNESYLRLKGEGIVPELCLDHGITLSYYYVDPDGNRVELQVDCFGDWAASSDWIRNSADFHSDPLGSMVDPYLAAADVAAGLLFAEVHRKARAGEYSPGQDSPGGAG